MKELKNEILSILISYESPELNSITGERTGDQIILSENYEDITIEIMSLIQALTDPENQPNQYGIDIARLAG